MILQVAAYVVGILLAGYLMMRCFGRFDRLSERSQARRQQVIGQLQQHYEQVAEYERRKANGLAVGPPPRMPWRLATLSTGLSRPWF